MLLNIVLIMFAVCIFTRASSASDSSIPRFKFRLEKAMQLFDNYVPLSEPSSPIAGLDQRFDDNGVEDIACVVTLQDNMVRKSILTILENRDVSEPHKLDVICRYEDLIYNATRGICDLYAGGLMHDFDFYFEEGLNDRK